MKLSPRLFKLMLNCYPPYIGAGVKVDHVSQDWQQLQVSMPLRWYNRNAVGTHFGGSLYSMVDPHIMLLLMQIFGKDYLIWDKSADIEFIKPGQSKVTAVMTISDEDIQNIRDNTANGDKYFAHFTVDIVDASEQLVSRVRKVIYIRKKPQARAK
ncbi:MULTISPECIES: YiiD C-terminal domain-containing protein [unclassified Spongiibacter]|uniref:YiiD C-terminal domain-containing protein n=1 Tax=Spongiibacter TaxID=630749 RepID=UPI000C09E847|nr:MULTISPECIES: YiiD C-terminal domain-containing protein [unclassified Spongiibacter]MAK45537.1 tetrameric acyl-CoA thioesterase [Spongiibacter sp.]MEE2652355.1 YiiD C-terminal domain-containing protein [Pseudomonadota bacterium]